jgi:hypothetical protein
VDVAILGIIIAFKSNNQLVCCGIVLLGAFVGVCTGATGIDGVAITGVGGTLKTHKSSKFSIPADLCSDS